MEFGISYSWLVCISVSFAVPHENVALKVFSMFLLCHIKGFVYLPWFLHCKFKIMVKFHQRFVFIFLNEHSEYHKFITKPLLRLNRSLIYHS